MTCFVFIKFVISLKFLCFLINLNEMSLNVPKITFYVFHNTEENKTV